MDVKQKTAVIFGVTGQDGSYLSQLLVSKGYEVVGVARRVSVPTDSRLHIAKKSNAFSLVPGDVTDLSSVIRIISKYHPDEVYNLAAQSHVAVSFDEPLHTWGVTASGVINILEAIRITNPTGIRFYQASSSEMFGKAYSYMTPSGPVHVMDGSVAPEGSNPFQNESTPFLPQSPYGVAKLAGHHAVRLYRGSYGIFACSGILFNHESERRGENFVTRKISKWAAGYAHANSNNLRYYKLELGNVSASRDWGHAEDYVYAMWAMLQQPKADDYVVATGVTHTVQEFAEQALAVIGKSGDIDNILHCSKTLERPSEVQYLRGDASKARDILGWAPTVSFGQLARRMVLSDIETTYGNRLKSEIEVLK